MLFDQLLLAATRDHASLADLEVSLAESHRHAAASVTKVAKAAQYYDEMLLAGSVKKILKARQELELAEIERDRVFRISRVLERKLAMAVPRTYPDDATYRGPFM